MTWKAVERRTARALGLERTGCTGTATPDCEDERLVVEVKHRKALPAWLKQALAQAQQHAHGRTAIVVLHEAKAHDSYVLMSFSDFVKWWTG